MGSGTCLNEGFSSGVEENECRIVSIQLGSDVVNNRGWEDNKKRTFDQIFGCDGEDGGSTGLRTGRRGRPKGSKNKNKKIVSLQGERGSDQIFKRGKTVGLKNGRRGRPKGSKNRKKNIVAFQGKRTFDQSFGCDEDRGEVIGKRRGRRGRPKGSKNKKKKIVEGDVSNQFLVAIEGERDMLPDQSLGCDKEEAETIGQKSGRRGRPKGSKNKKKIVVLGTGRRGRPKGSRNKKKIVVLGTGHRGRPKGSRNNKKSNVAGDTSSSDYITVSERDIRMLSGVSGDGTDKPKCRPGRPKGSKNIGAGKTLEDHYASILEVDKMTEMPGSKTIKRDERIEEKQVVLGAEENYFCKNTLGKVGDIIDEKLVAANGNRGPLAKYSATNCAVVGTVGNKDQGASLKVLKNKNRTFASLKRCLGGDSIMFHKRKSGQLEGYEKKHLNIVATEICSKNEKLNTDKGAKEVLSESSNLEKHQRRPRKYVEEVDNYKCLGDRKDDGYADADISVSSSKFSSRSDCTRHYQFITKNEFKYQRNRLFLLSSQE